MRESGVRGGRDDEREREREMMMTRGGNV